MPAWVPCQVSRPLPVKAEQLALLTLCQHLSRGATEHLFHHLLSFPEPSFSDFHPQTKTHLHLSDFNSLVLSLVTIPNFVLIYYFSTLIQRGEPLPSQGEVDLDESLLSGFTAALRDRDIEILLHSGPWEGLSLPSSSTSFSSGRAQDKGETEQIPDLILSSETTYNSQTVDSLCSTLLRLTSPLPPPAAPSLPQPLILIATKNYYFGLGGGVVAFLRRLEEIVGQERKVEVEHVMQSHTGVKRCVLSIGWV